MTSTITVISAQFAEDLSANDDQSGQPVDTLAHIAGTEVLWESNGIPSRLRSVRTWLSFWQEQASAEQFLEQRYKHIPLLERATDVLTGLLQPFASHGDVNWMQGSASPMEFDLAKRPDKDEPVFVITTVGVGSAGPGLIAFGKGTYAVRRAMQDHETVKFEAQIVPDDPAIDGPTLSLWDNQKAVIDFAYKQDPHKTAMQVMEHPDLARGSFTRCRVKSFDGVWHGKRVVI